MNTKLLILFVSSLFSLNLIADSCSEVGDYDSGRASFIGYSYGEFADTTEEAMVNALGSCGAAHAQNIKIIDEKIKNRSISCKKNKDQNCAFNISGPTADRSCELADCVIYYSTSSCQYNYNNEIEELEDDGVCRRLNKEEQQYAGKSKCRAGGALYQRKISCFGVSKKTNMIDFESSLAY